MYVKDLNQFGQLDRDIHRERYHDLKDDDIRPKSLLKDQKQSIKIYRTAYNFSLFCLPKRLDKKDPVPFQRGYRLHC